MSLAAAPGTPQSASVKARLGTTAIPTTGSLTDGKLQIEFTGGITIPTGGRLRIEIA
jgi:hypothetical protein